MCYHSSSPKVSCKYEAPRNSEARVCQKIKMSFEEEIRGLQGLVSEESYFKPHLTRTNVTLEVLLQEQLDVHKGKLAKYLSLKLYLCKKLCISF